MLIVPPKPISEMTDEEVLDYIEQLRKRRTERRDEMLASRGGAPRAPSAPRAPRLAKNEVDELTANILRNILGDDIKSE